MGQVLHHQESTERQYALREKALNLGWLPHLIHILDGDLGLSGTEATNRDDFKALVAEVSMNQVRIFLKFLGFHVPVPIGIDF